MGFVLALALHGLASSDALALHLPALASASRKGLPSGCREPAAALEAKVGSASAVPARTTSDRAGATGRAAAGGSSIIFQMGIKMMVRDAFLRVLAC